MIRLKYLAHIEMGQSPSSDDCHLDESSGLPFYQGTAEFGERYPTARQFCAAPPKQAVEGDVLFSVRAPVGDMNIAPHVAGIGRGLCAITPNDGVDRSYVWWALKWAKRQLDLESAGSTYEAVAAEDVGNVRLPLPRLEDQQAIGRLLDSSVGDIEILVTEKQRQLALLAEKRRALITRAVTQGLNQDAPLRDSGIAWLGELPAHWPIKRLKFVAEVRGGLTLGKDYGTQTLYEFPYMRVANVQDGFLDLSKVITVMVPAAEAAAGMLENGDVLMNEGGDIDKLGRGCVWRMEIANCLHQNHVFCVRPFAINSDWLDAWTSTDTAKRYFESRAKRATNLASISGSNVKELPVPLPPESEQLAILRHIAVETSKLDELTYATERTIALLHERRSALIWAAVSGQLVMENADACA